MKEEFIEINTPCVSCGGKGRLSCTYKGRWKFAVCTQCKRRTLGRKTYREAALDWMNGILVEE